MKATGRAASGGVGDRGDRTRAGRGGAELEGERPRGALGVNDWYLGYNRPGPRVYADLFSQVKSGDYIEVVALDSAAEERSAWRTATFCGLGPPARPVHGSRCGRLLMTANPAAPRGSCLP